MREAAVARMCRSRRAAAAMVVTAALGLGAVAVAPASADPSPPVLVSTGSGLVPVMMSLLGASSSGLFVSQDDQHWIYPTGGLGRPTDGTDFAGRVVGGQRNEHFGDGMEDR